MRILFLGLLCSSMMSHVVSSYVADIDWQDVYVVNNSNIDITITADVTYVSNINDLAKPTHRIEKQSWYVEKKADNIGGVNNIGKLYLLHNIMLEAHVADISVLPMGQQKPVAIKIKHHIPGKVLVMYINTNKKGWVVDFSYITAVKIVPGGPSGYHLEIEQR